MILRACSSERVSGGGEFPKLPPLPPLYIVSYFFNVDFGQFFWQDSGSQHMLMPAFGSVLHFLHVDCLGRNYGCNGRIKVSSTALDSCGSLIFNAAPLAIISAVLAMIQHERSAGKITISKGLAAYFPYVFTRCCFDYPLFHNGFHFEKFCFYLLTFHVVPSRVPTA